MGQKERVIRYIKQKTCSNQERDELISNFEQNITSNVEKIWNNV